MKTLCGKMESFFLTLWLLVYMVKVKVKFTLEEATKAQRGSRDIGLLFL
jgi:hypothetical protein